MSGNYDLCADARAVAEVIGRERALFLVGQVVSWERRPGSETGRSGSVYVPTPPRLKASCRLVKILGMDESARLSLVLGGEILHFSGCSSLVKRFRHEAVRRMASSGMPNSLIAWSVGLTARHVRTILARS